VRDLGNERRRGTGDTEHHVLTVGDKDILGGRPLRLRRAEYKAVAKERMGWVNNLDLGQFVCRDGLWVVERGSKVCDPSTRYRTGS
jgi:hypothetical protein